MHPLYSFTYRGEPGWRPLLKRSSPTLFIQLLCSEAPWKGDEKKVRDFGAVDLLISAVVIAVTVPILVQLLPN